MTKREKKGILLHLPQEIFEIMKLFKSVSGVNYTNQLYNAITWWLASKGLLDLGYIKKKSKELVEKDDQLD